MPLASRRKNLTRLSIIKFSGQAKKLCYTASVPSCGSKKQGIITKNQSERTGVSFMKLSAHALRALQELDDNGRDAVEQIVRAHIRACRLNGFQPENLERVYQEAIEIIRLEGPPKKDLAMSANKYEPTRRYEQYRSPRAL
jgi:hypothetical protein